MNITELLEDSHKTARAHGWWDKGLAGPDGIIRPKTFSTSIGFVGSPTECMGVPLDMIASKLMLAVSELAEALEEVRSNMDPVIVYWSHKGTEDTKHYSSTVREAAQAATRLTEEGFKPEGFPIEIADVFIRLADLCALLKIDLDTALTIKADYNRTRPYRHGNKAL